jgi:hypothetical protein
LRRVITILISLAVVAVLVVAGFVLGRRATKTPTVQPARASPATVVTRSGVLEETRSVQVTAEWQTDRVLFNRLAGTVTFAGLAQQTAQLVEPGTVLYSVDHRDVVVMAGEEPAYRDIVAGSKGTDVEQLQRFLDSVGPSPGPVDGVWGAADASGWNAWRRAQGMPKSSTVPLGEIVFVPGLPRMIAATDTLVLGRVVGGSEQMASLLQPSPSLSIVVPTESSLGLAPGMKVEVEIGSQQVATQVSTRRSTVESGVRVELDPESDGCGDWCGAVRVGAPSTWRGVAHISPPVSGTIVPIGALRTGTGAGTSVVLGDGRTQEVTVLAKVGPEAVVDGIKPGDTLQLPGSPDASNTTATSNP